MTPAQFDKMLAIETFALFRFAEATGFNYRKWLEPIELKEYDFLVEAYDQECTTPPLQDGTCGDLEPEDECGCCGCTGCQGCENCLPPEPEEDLGTSFPELD